jgi:hypothetical protein
MPKRKQEASERVIKPFNPLAKDSLGRSLTEAFLESTLHPFPIGEKFPGAGVYALYYYGNLQIYEDLVRLNLSSDFGVPIYVGKAVPQGSRKGGVDFDSAAGHALQQRLGNHANSIKEVNDLHLQDFKCRYLIVDDVWISLAESLLIEKFQPLWNKIVDGFGNNPQGSGRHDQKKSPWDALHPGRKRAEPMQPAKESKDQIESKVRGFLGAIRHT